MLKLKYFRLLHPLLLLPLLLLSTCDSDKDPVPLATFEGPVRMCATIVDTTLTVNCQPLVIGACESDQEENGFYSSFDTCANDWDPVLDHWVETEGELIVGDGAKLHFGLCQTDTSCTEYYSDDQNEIDNVLLVCNETIALACVRPACQRNVGGLFSVTSTGADLAETTADCVDGEVLLP